MLLLTCFPHFFKMVTRKSCLQGENDRHNWYFFGRKGLKTWAHRRLDDYKLMFRKENHTLESSSTYSATPKTTHRVVVA
ncbi:hypothetical protein SCOR_28935 [Sulfidibacter corallicola]